ncbi:MAG: T9SS type A sorting domain-containing protein, partial [Bacteroidota bacterium]
PFVIQGIPTFMSPTFTIRSLEDPFCEVDVPVQAPDCEGCSIGLELNDPIFNDGGTPGDPTDDTYTIEVLVLGEFGSGSWITPNGLTGAYGESATFTFPCDEEAAIVEVFDAEDPNCSASVNLSEFYTCPEVNICDAFDLLVEYLPGENCEDIPDVQITVEGLDPPFDITVVNENGAIVFQETASLNTSFILDDLEAGVYVIEAESSTGCARGFDLLVQEGTPFEIQLDYVPNSEECGTGGFIRPTTDPTIPLQFLQWYWVLPNGSIFTDPVTPTIDVNEPGTYTYVATNTTNNCTAQASITLSPDLFLGCVSVTGTLWADEGSCELEGGEIPVPGWAVQIYSTDGTLVTYVITDDNGNWSAELPAGEYFAESSPFQPDLYTSCDPPVGFTVGNMVQHVDVLMPYVEDCVIMYTHVSVGPLRVCEEQSVQVFYCNDGPIVAENAQIEVTFDDLLSIEQVSTPPAQVFDQTYIFNLGDLAPFECGNIEFTIMVACDVELGQSQCVEVIASPNAPCPSPESSWSGATVEVEVNCDQEEGVSFRIENTGLGDMSVPLEYVIIEDVIMMMGNPVVTDPLEATAGIDISLPADGTSYVVWANQEPGSPGAMMPIASIEGCGTDENGEFTTGVINQFATSPSDLDWYRLVCRPITGSFDPNAKVGYPLGYSDENLIEPGTRLTYDLYFQNTGNDFANKVVLVDSLADEFDLNTIRLGGASHPYTYTLDSNRVLTIVFEDIMLPDSTSDPIGSQGVVQFSIDHLADLPLGTVIENEVDIYFDFNAPITTNRTRHKLDREFLPTAVENPLSDLPYWFIYPNPTANWLWIDFPMQHRELESVEIIATDLLGREVLRDDMTQGQAINLKALPAATYLLRFQDRSGRILGKAELIKQ